MTDSARSKKPKKLSPVEAARAKLQTDIGGRIRDVREDLGVGQAECARLAKLDTSSLFRIETGKQNLTAETLARIALALGVGMDQLVIGVEPSPDILEARPKALKTVAVDDGERIKVPSPRRRRAPSGAAPSAR